MASAQPPSDMSENRQGVERTITIVCCCIVGVVLALRIYARGYLSHALGPDDILMICAALAFWGFCTAVFIGTNRGIGLHLDTLLYEKGLAGVSDYSHAIYFTAIFYNSTLGFIKLSVLALYSRLGDRILRKVSVIMGIIVLCSATANVLTAIFQCSPISAAWDLSITNARCVNINAFYIANAITNIITDLITYTLPIRLVLRLQIPKKQKIALGITFGLGLFACIASLIRLIFVPILLTSPDATWVMVEAMYWSVIETTVGILAASLPSFKIIAKRFLPGLLGSTAPTNSYPNYGSSSRTGDRRSRRPFSKMDEDGIALKEVEGKGASPTTTITADRNKDLEDGGNGSDASIEHDVFPIESHETIVVPEGQIFKQTKITSTVESLAWGRTVGGATVGKYGP